jgi:hydrogenase/urease accessory protein HupE
VKCVAVILAVCSAGALTAVAHEERPAYLEVREAEPDTYDILWKVPARGGVERLSLYVRFPAAARHITEPNGISAGGAYLERWQVLCPGGLAGQTISVDGLAATGTDVLVRMDHADGSRQTARLLPDRPWFVVEARPTTWSVAGAYLLLGIDHILFGFDHLLFVLALLLLSRGWKRLVGTITAFTVAHSITLAAAVLGVVHVPGPPVEACIALSIVFVAAEILRGGRGLSVRAPWLVALAFGLLHGLGFAGALGEVGLPHSAIPVALLFFNLGVEIGQLLFVAAAVVFITGARQAMQRLGPSVVDARLCKVLGRVPPYAIGSVAMCWVLQRVAAF